MLICTVISYIFSQLCPLSSLKIQSTFLLLHYSSTEQEKHPVRTGRSVHSLKNEKAQVGGRRKDMGSFAILSWKCSYYILKKSCINGWSLAQTRKRVEKTASVSYTNAGLKAFIVVEYKTFKLKGIYSIFNVFLHLITV